MSIQVVCPYCDKTYSVEPWQEGKTIHCACGQRLTILTQPAAGLVDELAAVAGSSQSPPASQSQPASQSPGFSQPSPGGLRGGPSAPPGRRPAGKPGGNKSPVMWIALGGAGLVVVVIGLVVLFTRSNGPPPAPPRSPLTMGQFEARIAKVPAPSFFGSSSGRYDRKDWDRIVGQPSEQRNSPSGTRWIYRCADGDLVLTIDSQALTADGVVVIDRRDRQPLR